MTKSHPAGGSRTLVGLLSTFALVGGVVGFQNAATAQEAATQRLTGSGVDVTPVTPAPETAPEAVPAPAPVVEAPVVEAPVVEAPAPAPAPAAPAPAAPAPAPAPVVAPAPAPAPVPSGTTGGSGG